MRNIGSLGIKNLSERAMRSVFAAGSIVLGVAVVFGVYAGTDTMERELARLQSGWAAGASIIAEPIGTADRSLPDGSDSAIASRPGVVAVVGSYEFAGSVGVGGRQEVPHRVIAGVWIAGIDPAIAGQLLGSESGAAPAQGAVVVSEQLADELGLSIGSTVNLAAGDTTVSLTVAGIAGRHGLVANNPFAAFTTLDTARDVAAGSGFTRLRVVLDQGSDPASWIDANSAALPGLDLTSASDVSNTAGDFFSGLGPGLRGMALLALMIGSYTIYLTFSTIVVERRSTYGLLRALGAERRQIVGAVLAEAAALGVVATPLGLLAGLIVGRVVTMIVGALFYADTPALTFSAGTVATAVAVGLAAPVLSVLVPAVRAAAVDPTVAMRDEPVREPRVSAFLVLLATVLAGLGTTVTRWGNGAGYLLVLWGAVILVPILVVPIAQRFRPIVSRLAPAGDIAVQHLVRARSRSAYTAGLVMAVLAVVLGIATVYGSQRVAFEDFVNSQFGADLEVDSYDGHALGSDVVGRVRGAAPGATTTVVGKGVTTLVEPSGGREALLMIDPVSYFAVTGFSWVRGNESSARSGLAGGGVLLPEIYARELAVSTDDVVVLATKDGSVPFTVAATYATFGSGSDRGIVIGQEDGRRHFGFTDPQGLYIDLPEGADTAAVEQQIHSALADRWGTYFIESGAGLRSEAMRQMHNVYGLFLVVVVIAGAVGVLGLANSLVVSVLTRVQEIGLLRAIGLHRREISAMTIAEALTLTLTGLVLAVPVGVLLGWLMLRGVEAGFGTPMTLRFPWFVLPLGAAVAVLFALFAALVPARRAVRLDPVAALRFE